MNSTKLDIGKRLEQIRDSLDLTQEEMGEKLGKGKGSVSKYENGEAAPQLPTLMKYAELGGVTFDWIFTGAGQHDIQNHQSTVYEPLERYSPESLAVADMFEVKVEGKTAQERLDFIREILDAIRRKG